MCQVRVCGDMVTNEATISGPLARVTTVSSAISNAKIVGEVVNDS